MHRQFGIVALLFLTSCGPPLGGDAGFADASSADGRDAGGDRDGGADAPDAGALGEDGGEPVDASLPTDAGDAPLDASLPIDGGPADAGAADAGGFDGGALDAGGHDGGAVDGGAVDGGAADGGALDAGPMDGGAPDAGAPDAGLDAGAIDAGAPDAGDACFDDEPPDGGTYGQVCPNPIDPYATFNGSPPRMETIRGRIATAGDADWHAFRFAQQVVAGEIHFDASVVLTGNPGDAFRIEVADGSCAASSCEGASLRQWRKRHLFTSCAAGPCPSANSTVYVRVFRVAGDASCDEYELLVQNYVAEVIPDDELACYDFVPRSCQTSGSQIECLGGGVCGADLLCYDTCNLDAPSCPTGLTCQDVTSGVSNTGGCAP